MKRYYYVTLFCSIFSMVKADLPYMPLKFELRSVKKNYVEGNALHFILTITNTDKEKTYPLLTPGKEASPLKVFILRVC